MQQYEALAANSLAVEVAQDITRRCVKESIRIYHLMATLRNDKMVTSIPKQLAVIDTWVPEAASYTGELGKMYANNGNQVQQALQNLRQAISVYANSYSLYSAGGTFSF